MPGVVNTAGGGPRPRLASYGTYIAGRILRVCRYSSATRYPVAIAVVLQRKTDQVRSPLSHCTQSRSTRRQIVCMTARLNVTPKTTEQNRIVCTGKSEAEVTN